MPDDPDQHASKLASLVRASRADFARLFDTEAAKRRPGEALPLHTLVQVSRFGAANRAEAETDAFAFRVAFRHAAAEGWLEVLVTAIAVAGMFSANDDFGNLDPAKAAIAKEVATVVKPAGIEVELQAVINPDEGFQEPLSLTRALHLATRRVCQILVDRGNTSKGSGFLVGPQTVLTNWHVVRALLKADRKTPVDKIEERLSVRFDRFSDSAALDGAAPSRPTMVVRAIAIESSDPTYPAEADGAMIPAADPAQWMNEDERLDFALVRLEEAIGVDRGWCDLLPNLWPQERRLLHVLQFPGQYAMRITHGLVSKLYGKNSPCRIRHFANTLEGSSGGLCLIFDPQTAELKPVALHQASVVAKDQNGKELSRDNQAIPLAKIAPKVLEAARRLDRVAPISRLTSAAGSSYAGAPVFGRRAFQEYVGQMVLGTRRILIVRPPLGIDGPARFVGKTFSERLLRSFLGTVDHQVVTIAAGDIPSDARALAQLVLDRVEAPAPRDPLPMMADAGTTETAWIADQLIRGAIGFGPRLEAAARGRLIWLVIDDLDRVDIPDAGGRRFLDALYQNIEVVPSLRIVLIGLLRDLPSISTTHLQIDKLSGPPGTPEIREWLPRRFGANRNVDDDIVEGLAKIAASFAGDGDRRAAAIAAAVRQHLDPHLPPEQPMPAGEN